MEEKQFEYRTGYAEPEKRSRGVIAILLVCVIFLAGLVAVMGFMNVRLTQLLADSSQEKAPLSFSEGEGETVTEDAMTLEGMALAEADPLYQKLHDLPEGLYVSCVEEGSRAEDLGIAPADVLLAVEETPVETLEQLQNLLDLQRGDLHLLMCRRGEHFTVTLSVSE